MPFEEAMQEVLQTRRYDLLMGRSRNLRDTVADFIDRHITALLERLNLVMPQGDGDSRTIPFIFAVVGGILLAVGTAALIRMFIRARRPKVHTLSDIFGELAGKNLTAEELIGMAETADRRLSVRYRYIAVLLAMDEGGLIRITPSATNALILRALRDGYPLLAQPFADMADTFHLAWFGNKRVSDGDFSSFRAVCGVLMGAARG
ncbi:MAG: DUF4129 domain-containing protein [Defluviitaleaceae bacterium]|nr:DUF4129 domain-containing protein [Defluviitaleaceae bacterium]